MRTFTYRSSYADSGLLQDTIAGIFNTDLTFGGQIMVHQVYMYPIAGQNPGGMARVRLSKISAVVGGTPIPAIKNDPSAPDLPAGVVLYGLPTTVTETVVLSNRIDAPNFSPTLVLGCIAQLTGGGQTLDLGRLFRTKGGQAVDPIVLREGDGLAAILTDYGYSHAVSFGLQVYNRTTGRTYTYLNVAGFFPRRESNAFAALYNAVGSGAVIEVRLIENPSEGTATIPQYRLSRVEGIPTNLLVEQAVGHDTKFPVPPWVTCGTGPALALLPGRGNGAPFIWEQDAGLLVPVAVQQRVGRFRNRVYAPWGADAESPLTGPSNGYLVYSDKGGQAPFIINPGEGLAILGGREGLIDDSTFNLWFTEFQFTVSSPQRLSMPGATYVS